MLNRKGFTLIEIVVALLIVGLLAAMAVPSYTASIQLGAARAAQNNLISIYNAEKNYYLGPVGNGNYYISATTPNDAQLNTSLGVNITDNYFQYSCSNASGFSCTAQNIANNNFKLIVTNSSIVLPGATGCTTGSTASCNPSCTDAANPGYCPVNN